MLQVNSKGRNYRQFDNISVSSSLDNICSQYKITTSLDTKVAFGKGDFLTILGGRTEGDFTDSFPLVSGYVEKVEGNITNKNTTIVFTGRDKLGDLVDSSVRPEVSSSSDGISLVGLCKKVLKSLNIRADVINNAGSIAPFSKAEIEAVEFGGAAGSFLQNFASKRHVFLVSNGLGDLVLFRPPTAVGYKDKLTKLSMLGRTFSYSDLDRFHTIEVGCEDNLASEEFDIIDPDLLLTPPIPGIPSAPGIPSISGGGGKNDSIDRRQSFVDETVRDTRYLQIQASESMSNAELKGKAEEEVNIRRARGFAFSCTVPSHIYDIGTLVKVDDDVSGVKGIFLIRGVEYSQSLQGEISNLTLCFPESYGGAGKRSTERKSKMDTNNPEELPDELNLLTLPPLPQPGFTHWAPADNTRTPDVDPRAIDKIFPGRSQ